RLRERAHRAGGRASVDRCAEAGARRARARRRGHPVRPSMQGELASRMAIVAAVERRRIRYAHMVGVTPEIMQQGMRADYLLVDRLSTRLCERMRTAQSLRVVTPFGTRLTATFDPALHWIKTSGLISTRYWSNLP